MTHHQSPAIAGREADLHSLLQNREPVWIQHTNLRVEGISSAFACALHMHQPTIPAGKSGELVSHLQYMFDNQGEGDNHNAESFAQCYRRMADLIPQLISEGCNPRIMLDYSGNLLWGVHQMGRDDITGAMRYLACDPAMQRHVEWLGTFWSHAVAPSTPIPDLKLQISAWQHQFFDLFGEEALKRVKGFSPPEMHLPNHPDTLHAFIQALNDCGYKWLMVQEHSVENLDGSPLSHSQKYLPNQLVARSSTGEIARITVLIKTQGSDTKLVGQMQPYYEALTLGQQPLRSRNIPSVVTQIADGENGGVMMNEFPEAFVQAHRKAMDQNSQGDSGQVKTVAINGSEWLELLEQAGVTASDFPEVQAVQQHRLWKQVGSCSTRETVNAAIDELKASNSDFSMEGASWTNNLSWVEGYDNVLEPMNKLSAAFHQHFDKQTAEDPSFTTSDRYQKALLHLLLLETSCFRYWGQGTWTEYARNIHSQGQALLS
ncbi:glycosyl hydrolase family 57 [Synechococcus sp. CC9311]|uniref:glycosyl hydrolase family 57 n=1 Tax=Synechococcus sp. (strain CC9311) TaxID=64471 RepID=UPI00059C047D|nr:glycosyl hydrolase family 57 [Synechococcus sp. CC9311]